MPARTRRAHGFDFDAGHQADAAHVDHAWRIRQRMHRVGEAWGHGRGALDEFFVAEDVHHRQPRRARRRMCRIGVAVEELDALLGAAFHDGVVDVLARGHRAHGLRAVGDGLGHGHQVGRDAEGLRAEVGAHAAPAGDDFVEHQEDALFVADGAQPVEVALGRGQAAERSCRGLDEHGGDVLATEQVAITLQVIGKLGALIGLATHHAVLRQGGVAHVKHAGQARAESAAVVDHAGQRHAAHVHAVVSPFARDEDLALGVATHTVKGQRHLHRRVDGFAARIGEEDAVQARRRELGHARRELERLGLRAQERRGEVQRLQLLVHRLGDLASAMAGGDAEQARRGVDDFAPFGRVEVHALGACHHLRRALEFLVRRERHPMGLHVGLCVGLRGDLWFSVSHGLSPVR